MKNLLLITVLSVAVLFTACNNAPNSDDATTKAPAKVENKVADKTKKNQKLPDGIAKYTTTANSQVTWIGSKPIGKHNGTMAIKDGTLMVADGKIEAASFIIDMKSLKVLDMDAKGNADLAGHLSSPDFFDVAKHPEAAFVMSSVKEYSGGAKEDDAETLKIENPTHIISGNLTIMGKAKNVEFPANVSISDNKVTAKANFNIDRTNWGISYGNDKSLGDKFISPTVNIGLDISATKS